MADARGAGRARRGGPRAISISPLSKNDAVCRDLDGTEKKTTLRGHELLIRFVTLSADGSRAATAAQSGCKDPDRRSEVFVWDAGTGRRLWERKTHNEVVSRIALDPTGKRLAVATVPITSAVASEERAATPCVVVIDVDSGQETLRHDHPAEELLALRFSRDGRRLAAAGVERTVLFWDVETCRVVAETRQGPEGAMDVDFSPDGRRAAIASRRQVTLVDAETAEAVLVLRGRAHRTPNQHGFNPRVRFSPDGQALFAICDDVPGEMFAEWSAAGDRTYGRDWRLRFARRRAIRTGLGDWTQPVLLMLAGDLAQYRLVREALWQRYHSVDHRGDLFDLAYYSALAPLVPSDAPRFLQVARQACDETMAGNDQGDQASALLGLGALQVRVGDDAGALESFQAAATHAQQPAIRAIEWAWMAIALAHQGRHAEAKTWFDQTDRFVRAQLDGKAPDPEQPRPDTVHAQDWWRLLLARREAEALVLDGSFPVDPLAH